MFVYAEVCFGYTELAGRIKRTAYAYITIRG